eukprot:TRINITY_DN8928_c1_g1_i1.p1 TRINITY_DN8928_c1_g1~~TRINITY_DN8928_c1_g1_i1.p1  ORF type:complete len:351 (-),score=53.02 TRINITY_DN8928_c1_g1_i1:798-1850(-)
MAATSGLNLDHIQRIRLARDDLERMVSVLPPDVFDRTIIGCTVKVLLEEENQSRVYRIAYITGVDEAQTPYKFGVHANTSKTLVLNFTIFKMSYQMNTISNSEFTEEEFRQWQFACQNNPPPPINVEHAEKKAAELSSVFTEYPSAARGRRQSPRAPRPAPRVAGAPPTTMIPGHQRERGERAGGGEVSSQVSTLLDEFFANNGRLPQGVRETVIAFGVHVDAHVAKEKQRMNHELMRLQVAGATGAAAAAAVRTGQAEGREEGVYIVGELDKMDLERLRVMQGQCDEMKRKLQQRIDEKSKCVICTVDDAVVILYPCKHQVLCAKCSPKVKDCPFCRSAIQDRFTPYKP